jgi:hypothetical protein
MKDPVAAVVVVARGPELHTIHEERKRFIIYIMRMSTIHAIV